MKTSFSLRGGVLCVLALALVAVLFISPGSASTAYYLIRTGHGGNDVVQTVPEGGSTTFKISFQARHIPHSEWTNVESNPATCFYVPATFLTGPHTDRGYCYVLIPENLRIRPVIEISTVSDATAHGWTRTTTDYPTTATAAWDHGGHQIEVYQYMHTVTVTATASNDTCKGPQTSTFTASIQDANASNAVLFSKTYTLRKRDNDPLASACS